MILYPAIDIKENRCVRLVQGDFKAIKIYDQNPLKVAKEWLNQGSKYLHVIDLDGAKSNEMINLETIKKLSELNAFIQVGGGIRSLDKAMLLLSLGIKRIILGTAALKNPSLLKQLLKDYPEKIAVSIDARKGQVTTHGWQKTSKKDMLSFAKQLESFGLKTLIYTDIEKDGMLKGPNFEDYALLLKHTNLEIIASGGVTTCDDLKRLKSIGVHGVIIGKALYEKKLSLEEAFLCSQNVSSPV